MINFFNKELFYRIISISIFIPLVIFPIFFSYYISIVVYLILTSIILIEIQNMKQKVEEVSGLNTYYIIAITSFFIESFLKISYPIPPEAPVIRII